MLCLTDVDTDEDVDVLDIHLSCHLSLHGCRASQWTTGPALTYALDLTRSGPFPLSAVTSARLPQVTLAPRIIRRQGQDTRAHSSWPSPGPPGTTNKVTGIISDDSVDADTNNDGVFDAGSGPGAEDQGGSYQIVGNHVYTVESIDDEYVTLINPWGNNPDASDNHVGSGGRIRITREEYATYFPSTDVGRTS